MAVIMDLLRSIFFLLFSHFSPIVQQVNKMMDGQDLAVPLCKAWLSYTLLLVDIASKRFLS